MLSDNDASFANRCSIRRWAYGHSRPNYPLRTCHMKELRKKLFFCVFVVAIITDAIINYIFGDDVTSMQIK